MVDGLLAGTVAVVTGASRGVGKAAAIELAAAGATVVVTARTVEPRSDVAGTILETVSTIESQGGTGVAFAADLLDEQARQELISQTLERFGRIDVLVNNAAHIGEGVFQTLWEAELEDWRAMLELNVTAAWSLTKAAASAMRNQGCGLVINVSSSRARSLDEGPPRQGGMGAAYPTSKAALNQMTSYLAGELLSEGIVVLALDPGFTRSESAEVLAHRMGHDLTRAHSPFVAGKAIRMLAEHSEKASLAGRLLVARELVD